MLLITGKIAICSAISLREPITFELDDEIPGTLDQVTHKLNKVQRTVYKFCARNVEYTAVDKLIVFDSIKSVSA
jgi:hypothetical protein